MRIMIDTNVIFSALLLPESVPAKVAEVDFDG